MPTDAEIEQRTKAVAQRHGCDRAVFTVCWGELERGETCRCKQDAIEELQAKS